MEIPIIPSLIALGLSIHGYRKKSLSPSGALAALVVGFSMMSTQPRAYGISLIAFYLFGSRATKVGKDLKANLEEGHEREGNEGAGYRTAWQVLCNSFMAFGAACAWRLVRPIEMKEFDLDSYCPISPEYGSGLSRSLLYLCLGHFACCLGDTLASELGILSKSPPRLITTLKTVPPGTNGAISKVGTIASICGGAVMGLTMWMSLLIENAKCRSDWLSLGLELLLWGTFGGAVGSQLDSLMGATIQQTKFSTKTKRVLLDESSTSGRESEIRVVSGLNLLTNNQVNLISSIVTSLFVAYLAS